MKKTILLAVVLILCIFIFLPIPCLFAGNPTPKIREYTLNQNIHVQLSPSIRVSENPLGERKQLVYSVYLDNDELLLRGYIQVWQLDDVEKFLATSKEMSCYDFYSYSVKPIMVGNLSGIVNEWGASFGDLSKISGKEYWLKKVGSSEVLRIAFLTSNFSFAEEQLEMIRQILATLHWE